MGIEIALKNVVTALNQISVRGSEAKLFVDTLEVLKSVIRAIEKAKEEEANANRDKQREDV